MFEDNYEKGYQKVQAENPRLAHSKSVTSLSRHQGAQFTRTEHVQHNKDGTSDVEAEYSKGKGGRIRTLSRFGRANLSQEFVFGPDGDLIGVTLEKRLKRGLIKTAVKQLTSGDIPLPPEMSIRLSRNHEGKFEVTQRSSTPDLKEWEDEFAQNIRKHSSRPHETSRSEYEENPTGLAAPTQQTNTEIERG